MIPKENAMLRTITARATLLILAILILPSTGRAQEDTRPPSYRIPGDSTLYAPRQDAHKPPVDLVPVPGTGAAKAPEPISYFHLEFVIKTMDNGKVISSRTYTMDANTDNNHLGSSVRSDTTELADPTHPRTQTNLDCNTLRLVGTNAVSMQINTAIMSNSNSPGSGPSPLLAPDTSYSGAFNPLVPFGKPTIVFSAEGPTPSRRIQMEVTATPIHIN
jgi:hypothetical protein